MALLKGKVKFLNSSKGFGFIVNAETKKDVFVHVNDCKDDLSEGDEVEFEEGQNKKGVCAKNVRLAN